MSIEHHSISVHFVQTVIQAAKRGGLDQEALLQKAGLNDDFLQMTQVRITPDQFSRLVLEVWKKGDDEFLGMGSQPSRYGVFALMAKQAINCRNLKSAYYHVSRFYNLVADAITLTMEVRGDEVFFTVELTDPDKDPDHALCELLMLLWHRFPSWLIGQRIELKEAHFMHAEPEHVAEYRLMYPCPAKFQQTSNCLIFDRKWLQAPVVQTKQTLHTYLQRSPSDWFKRQAYYPVFTRKVMTCLEREDDCSQNNMEEVAAELNVTSRTLRRKLTEEGTSFQQLKDGIRRDAAIHYLSQPNVPIAEISQLLGFSEPAAFTRAFKQWTGVPPAVYRCN